MSRTEWDAALTVPVSDERDHVQGQADAAVTLVEYGDYECPYCGAAYPIIKQVQARMGGRLRFVFRNFPITTSHPHAEPGGRGRRGCGDSEPILGDARPSLREPEAPTR
jgi:protein-disulfide isomerase